MSCLTTAPSWYTKTAGTFLRREGGGSSPANYVAPVVASTHLSG